MELLRFDDDGVLLVEPSQDFTTLGDIFEKIRRSNKPYTLDDSLEVFNYLFLFWVRQKGHKENEIVTIHHPLEKEIGKQLNYFVLKYSVDKDTILLERRSSKRGNPDATILFRRATTPNINVTLKVSGTFFEHPIATPQTATV